MMSKSRCADVVAGRGRGPGRLLSCLLAAVIAAAPAAADVSGFVLEQGTDAPIAGARVHLQADPTALVVLTAMDGSFSLPLSSPDLLVISASIPYDPLAAVNYNTGGTTAFDGDTGVTIRLNLLPAADNPSYDPVDATLCGNCHPNQLAEWQTANHSFAAIDEWVLDLFSGTGTAGGGAGYVYRNLHDPGETGFCSTCHTPMAEAFNPGGVYLDEVTDVWALDGVGCSGCHQIDSVDGDVNALHVLGNSTYRFPDGGVATPTWQFVWGPLDDVTFGAMRASYAPYFRESRLCASCHQYNNPDTGAPGQNTYGEWLASSYAVPGSGYRTCQSCHMPDLPGDGVICEVGGPPTRPSSQRHAHTFVGATPDTLQAAILLNVSAADAGGRVSVDAQVTNAGAGHSFPTGVSIRNALLVVEATYQGQPLAQVAGPTIPFWADDEVPGQQPGDYAGAAGKGFAKVLQGRINGQGPVLQPVLFIDAEGVYANTLIPAGGSDLTHVEFQLPETALPGETVEVSARLLYRRAWRALAVTKGWTQTPQGGPIEIEVAAEQQQLTLVEGGASTNPLEIPAASTLGLVLLAALLALAAVAVLRR